MTVRGPMTRAVADSLRAAQVADSDKGAVQLCKHYARLIDDARGSESEVDVSDRLGPKLLAALTALGLTLAGRGARGGAQGGPSNSKLDELRARRARRVGEG